MARRRTALVSVAVLASLAGAGCGGGKEAPAPTTTSEAPTGTTEIQVLDGDTRQPLAGATVTAFDTSGQPTPATTDAAGRAGVPAGTNGACALTPVYPQECRTVLPGRPRVTIPLYDPRLQSPEYGGGPSRTRYVPAVQVPPPSGPPAWRRTGKVLLEFPPSVSSGFVALATNRGRVYVLDARTGGVRWQRRHPTRRHPASSEANNIASSPAILAEDKKVIVSGMDGRLVAYDLADGRVLWEFSAGESPIESSPLVVGETVYVGAWNGRLYAVSTKTGRRRWDFQASDDIKGSAAQAGDMVVFGDYAGNVYGLRRSDGSRVWRARLGKRFYGGPAVVANTAVIGDVGGGVVAFDVRSGRRLWRHSAGVVYSSPAIARGTVFIGSYDGRFEALDLATGKLRWSFATGGRISGSATVVGTTVYTSVLARPGERDRTYGLDVRNGSVRWEGADGRYSPAVAAGRTLYIVGRTTLYAYPAP